MTSRSMKGNHRVHEPIIPCNPPVYRCRRATRAAGPIDGDLSKPFWQDEDWIEEQDGYVWKEDCR